MAAVLTTHEVKSQPAVIPQTKIVEAYGLRKCPKLVEQVAGHDIDVRINALSVLCDEFNNPYSISGCAQAGIIKVLACMVIDPDYVSRERASKALSLAARDACGLDAILVDEAIGDILLGKDDPSDVVRGNVYECLLHCTRTAEGVAACNRAGVTDVFVGMLPSETAPLKSLILKTLLNIVGSEDGLIDALNAGAVEVCINILSDDGNKDLLFSDAAKTLGFICFDERGKDVALNAEAMQPLIKIISDRSQSASVKGSVLNTIMAITSTDEGKRQMNNDDCVDSIVALLYDNDRIVKMNSVKVIANIAVYPPIRIRLAESTCLTMLKKVRASGDRLLEKHALIAIEAVQWQP